MRDMIHMMANLNQSTNKNIHRFSLAMIMTRASSSMVMIEEGRKSMLLNAGQLYQKYIIMDILPA